MQLYNDSAADLILTTVVTSGDPEFKFRMSWDTDGGTGTTISGDESAYVALEFAPLAMGVYAGALTIESNAENSPSFTLALRGCGVAPDAGTSSCYP